MKHPLRLYNTLTRTVEPFEPLVPGKVGIYLCGLTVYDHWHLGHGLQSILFDAFVRYLEGAHGYEVTFVNNYTDIDDKILDRAGREGVPYSEVSRRYIESFEEDLPRLHIREGTLRPRATGTIPEILAFIEDLERKGHAYVAGDGVYFDVRSLPQYGELSGNRLEDQRAGASTPALEGLRHPADFALWKFSREDEPGWDSRWGRGRPGWHIECSAMSLKHLGVTFDIHAGGIDLIFPHHENEKAQSEGAHGPGTFARTWMHNGLLTLKGEKMSKSLGNTMRTRLLLDRFGADPIRHFVLSSHYRSPGEYEDKLMEDSVKAIRRLHRLAGRIEAYRSAVAAAGSGGGAGTAAPAPADRAPAGPADLDLEAIDRAAGAFDEALADDFNTPRALAAIFTLASHLNRRLNELETAPADPHRAARLASGLDRIRQRTGLLGFRLDEEGLPHHAAGEADFTGRLRDLVVEFAPGSAPPDTLEAVLEALIARRAQARKDRDFGLADAIRNRLAGLGVELRDGPAGTRYTFEDRPA